MSDILTKITQTAVKLFRLKLSSAVTLPQFFDQDPVLAEAQAFGFIDPTNYSEFRALSDDILSVPEFEVIAPKEGVLDPMVLSPNGGTRGTAQQIIISLFSSALFQMYFLRLPSDEGVFVRTVLENFEELRKAVRGEPVRGYALKGIARLTIPQNTQITTPWGIIRPASTTNGAFGHFSLGRPVTKCILAESRLLPIVFDRSSEPNNIFDQAVFDQEMRASILFPLACALASDNAEDPIVPVMTWSTFLMPFQGSFGYSYSFLMPMYSPERDFGNRVSELEEWARIVDRAHTPEVDIAAKRLVSAVAHRLDRADSLIDAVMVWENLLGTSNEVTFRVSASLSKLISKDPAQRLSLKKSLSNIYAVRSRLVHGSHVDASTIEKSSSEAIGAAVRALQESYQRGRNWLAMRSNERSDKILLEWQ